jgi:electron transport complex protein RnfG
MSDDNVPVGGSFTENLKMILTVVTVCIASAALLGFVYSRTKEPIARSRQQELVRALGYILPEHDNQPAETQRSLPSQGFKCRRYAYTGTQDGRTTGRALQTCTTQGFGPIINLLVGVSEEGAVTGVYILSHQETPGLGAKITEEQQRFPEWRRECKTGGCPGNRPFLKQFANRRADTFTFRVKRDGGDVAAITASTISSRAVSQAVLQAVEVLSEFDRNGGGR